MVNFELTKREKEIVDLVCTGLTNYEVSTKLKIRKKTVDNHLTNIFLKTCTNNRTQLISFIMPLQSIEEKPKMREIDIIKRRKKRYDFKKINCNSTKNELKIEVNRLKTQRLKAALIAACLIDYISSDYIRNELKTLMVALRP